MKSQEFIAQALLEWLSNALATAPDVHRAGLPIMDVEYFLARLSQVAGFEPGQFSLALVGFGGSATDLEQLAAKYGLASLRGLSDDLYAAARWRNHRLAHGRILAFCAGRHPGVHTLQHFTRAGSRELAQALLKWARDQGGFPVSEPQRLLLHELATNQELMPLLSLEAVAEFLAAWQRCGEHDPADAPRRALPALGLYADPQLFSAQKTLQRLLANLGLSQKLRELPGSKLREKRRQIEKYRDQATRERLLDVLAKLEAQRLGNVADIALTLDEVSQLISLPRDKIGEPEEQGPVEEPGIRDEDDLDRKRLKAQCTNALLDNRHETLQAAAGALEEAWQEYVPGEGAELQGEFESEGETYTFSLSIDTGLLNWLETFCAPEVWAVGWKPRSPR